MQVLEKLFAIILTILAQTFDFGHKNKKITKRLPSKLSMTLLETDNSADSGTL